MEVHCVGATVASMVFPVFTDNEQLGIQVQDCAPLTAYPGVHVKYAEGSRPTFGSNQGSTTILQTAADSSHKVYVDAWISYKI
jgi:ornithine carbamoyltransferase